MKLLYLKLKLFYKRLLPIAKPKGFDIGAVPAGRVTRQIKRNATIQYNGRTMNILLYMEKQAKNLPPMLISDTNEKVDHYACLKTMYMEYGLDGVHKYLKHVRRCYNRTTKPSRIRKKYNELKQQKDIEPCTQLN